MTISTCTSSGGSDVDLHTIIGMAGAAGYVTSYAMLQLGFLDGNGVRYSVANVAAATLVLISLTDQFNLASAVIQVIWIAIGVSGLVVRMFHRRGRRATAQIAPIISPKSGSAADADRPRLQPVTKSPFRAAPTPGRTSHDLRPDRPRVAGKPALGLRADVVASYQSAVEA